MVLAYGGVEQWFPDIEQQARGEQGALERHGLTDSESTAELGLETGHDVVTGASRARYSTSVSASGSGGSIRSETTVTLDYQPERTVSVVGPPVVQIDPETGLGPVRNRPAFPYVVSYSRTITYSDRDGRTATVEVDGHVFLSEATMASQLGRATPSYEALLGLEGDNGYMTASVHGDGPVTGYFANHTNRGVSLDLQSRMGVAGLGTSGGLSLIDVSAPASFLDPRLTVGDQYAAVRTFLLSADAAELARRREQAEAASRRGPLADLTDSLADSIGGPLAAFIDSLDRMVESVQEWWNELPPWARGILTAVGKFAAVLAVMAAIAGLIVLATEGAIAFGVAMLILGVAALAVGFVMSLVSRIGEAWNSDNRWRLLLAPTVAALDTIGISGIIEGATNESILTGEPLNLTEEEQWETGTTGVLQLVGIFLMARGLRGSPGGRTVTPEVRGPMSDFHALPLERLPRLPEGHYWARQGPEWVLFREPNAPEVPIEISIFSDGQGNINYNIRTGSRVLQSEAMTRPSGDTYQGSENRLPSGLRETGENNPFLEEGTGRLFEKGHGIDYVDRIEGPGVRSSNADPANFTPQARFWNSFLRNHLVRAIRGRGGGYREMPIYESNPSMTANETPIPSEFIFVETTPTGEPAAAWRIPNDPAITTRTQAELPQYSIDISEIPSAMIESSGRMRPPGAIAGPFGFISGQRGEQEEGE